MDVFKNEQTNSDVESSSFSEDETINTRADNYELLINNKHFDGGNTVQNLYNVGCLKRHTPGRVIELNRLKEAQYMNGGDAYISPPTNWTSLNQLRSTSMTLKSEKRDKLGILELWTKYNDQISKFDNFYDGKNERELLQNIFHNITKLSRQVGLSRDETPVGVFCSTRDDLIKLDILLHKIQGNLERNSRPKRKYCGLM